jgi:uncharacterized protein (DUF1501 family)
MPWSDWPILWRLARLGEERGDVPGWVLITAMTVALVMLVWGVASEALRDIITGFLDQVRFD